MASKALMELGLSLGDAPKPPFELVEKSQEEEAVSHKGLSFCMSLSIGSPVSSTEVQQEQNDQTQALDDEDEKNNQMVSNDISAPIQLDLLPHTPVPRNPPQTSIHGGGFPWSSSENDVNRVAANLIREADQEIEDETERGSNSRASDEDESGSTRKKLRLSKEQSAFLEESFKEHSTLNPKQKLALAKQLNLRPRQVEVWFQNRRARTKLKQTEVDCEYLKRCCEKLTEENRRLQKELQDLRALKTTNSFYMQLPATTLTMCPSCERVATTSSASTTATNTTTTTADPISKAPGLSFTRPRSNIPFPLTQNQPPRQSKAS